MDRVSGLRSGGRATLAIQPQFQQMPDGGPHIEITRVVGVLIGSSGQRFTAVATIVGDQATMVFDVVLTGSSETFSFHVDAFDENGDIVFSDDVPRITITPGNSSPTVNVDLQYKGPGASVTRLAISPTSLQLNAGGSSSPLSVEGFDESNTSIATGKLGWTSRDETVATVNEAGVVVAGAFDGNTWIVARNAGDIADSILVTVRAGVATVVVAPAPVTLFRGEARTFTATPQDTRPAPLTGRTVVWSTSNAGIVSINASTGAAQAVAIGTATITATSEGKAGTSLVTVVSPVDRIDLTPTSRAFTAIDQTQQFTATLVPRTGASVTGIVPTWSIDNTTVATVTSSGLVTARANGTATLTVTADGKTTTAALSVTQAANSVRLTPTTARLQFIGASQSFAATALDANNQPISGAVFTWSVTNTSILSVTTDGVVTGLRAGTADVQARMGTTTGTATVTVEQAAVGARIEAERTTLNIGETLQLVGYAYDAANNRITAPVTWSTSNASVLDVGSTSGIISANGNGSADITVTSAGVSTSVTFTVGSLGGIGTVTGRVMSVATQSGVSGAIVSSGGGQTTTGADGTFSLAGVASGSTLHVAATGYVETDYFDVHVASGGSTPIGFIPLAPISESHGNASGIIRDAVTGSGIAGATITVRRGVNATSGTEVANTSSASGGGYSLSLPAGTYTITATSGGYGTSTAILVSLGGQSIPSQNVALVPLGSGNELRIVVTWGPDPRDLDSYLFLPNDPNPVYYGSPTRRDASENLLASLDQDVTGGFGPETITIPSQIAGTYRYAIRHFSGAATIATSGATVKVYRGGTEIAEFHAPSGPGNGSGDIWVVFSLNGETLTPINVINTNGSFDANRTSGPLSGLIDAMRSSVIPKVPR